MATSQQPDRADYVVVSDILYIDGKLLRKGERLGQTAASPRLYHLLERTMIRRVEDEDEADHTEAKTC